jgi:pimeloyl-ACP methyl ester carboxylesterase
MSTFLFIHGAWHGGWCWEKVIPLLQRNGHKVLAPDLPGHGADRTPLGDVTLKAYTHRVLEVIDSCSEPVVLVGHSMGGIVLSQVAEQRPDSIRVLVYLCAFLVPDGESLLHWAAIDPQALVPPNLVFSEDGVSATVKQDALRDAFYGDCSDEDAAWAMAQLRPQALAPQGTAIHTTANNFGRVPRVYVECLKDRAITPSMQRQMRDRVGCDRVFTLDSSHSPFLSMPVALTEILLSAAGVETETRKSSGAAPRSIS